MLLQDEIEKNIQMLREKVNKINRNQKWMSSKQFVENMDNLNRTIGRLMALDGEVEKAKKFIHAEKTETATTTQTTEQTAGPH